MSSAADTKTTLTWVLKDEVSGPAKGVGSSLGGLVNPTTLAIGAVAGLAGGLAVMVRSAMDAQKITAQTAAVIASTGGAAKLTAEQVSNLATRISEYSGIDDGAVQAGENLLLTFTNIKDEVGEGNDIFTQATEIMADMATAMGTDMSSQAIQLGKALNDPVAGIGALSRVGVTFTEEQKTMIQSMSDAGDMAGAQAVIMAELTKEFGGSAEAAGSTADGAFLRLQNKIGELGEEVGTALLPKLTELATFVLEEVVPRFEEFVAAVGPELSQAFRDASRGAGVLVDALAPLLDAVKKLTDAAGGLGNVWAGVMGVFSPGFGIPIPHPAPNIPPGGGSGAKGVAPVKKPIPPHLQRAAGGDVDPFGTYLVGEQGPEMLVMGNQGGSIIPGGMNGGAPVELAINIDGDEIARVVDRRLYLAVQAVGGYSRPR